jgi:hypothetical protein
MPENLFTTFADRVMDRVEEVLSNRECRWPPSHDQLMLLGMLKAHRGRDRAVPLSEVCGRLKLSPRIIKDLVQDLRLNFGVQIGASRDSAAGGYYLITTEAESIESTTQMLHQALTMLEVARVMRGHRTIAEMFGQLTLNLDQDLLLVRK